MIVRKNPASRTAFEYWVQKRSTAPASGSASLPPHKFIKRNYSRAVVASFGIAGRLSTRVVLRKVEVVCAALSAGYGGYVNWNPRSVLAGASGDLRRYLNFRLEMLASCLTYSGRDAKPKPFFEAIETTEKGALSFVAGCVGTHIAARVWLKAGGTTMRQFLHSSSYTKASAVVPSRVVRLNRTTRRGVMPDFLVLDGGGDWHVFESKGGVLSKRWVQIVRGLEQLDNVASVGFVGAVGPPVAPRSKCCVQTALESDRPVSVALVDPPGVGEGDRAEGDDAEGAAIRLVPGVAELLALIETLDCYHSLADPQRKSVDDSRALSRWSMTRSSAFGGCEIGLPRAFIEFEDMVRVLMAWYLAVQQALENLSAAQSEGGGSKLPPDARAFAREFRSTSKLIIARPDSVPTEAEDVYRLLSEDGSAQEFGALYGWARRLRLAEFAEGLEVAKDNAVSQLAEHAKASNEESDSEVTPAGLYVRLTPWAEKSDLEPA